MIYICQGHRSPSEFLLRLHGTADVLFVEAIIRRQFSDRPS